MNDIINANAENGVLGVDFGGVILDLANDGTDSSLFGEQFLEAKPMDGVFYTLARLRAERFGAHIHIVSTCGAQTQARIRQWLDHHRFWERTGVAEGCLHFCRKRHEKAGIVKRLGITHFVDDRVEVLSHLTGIGLKRYAFCPHDEKKFARCDRPYTVAYNWEDLLREFCDNVIINADDYDNYHPGSDFYRDPDY